MKANRKGIFRTDDRAQVGIGTMIVFIATILVAATAAAVLIDTSGKLQERSSKTGNEATQEVSSNLIVKGIYGDRSGSTKYIENLNLTLGLAPGASAVDLKQLKILMSDGDTRIELDWRADCGIADVFCVSEVRDPKGTISNSAPVMTAGGLVNLEINLLDANAGANLTFAERSDVTVQLIPEVGTAVNADFTTPAAYGADTVIILR